MSKIEYPTE